MNSMSSKENRIHSSEVKPFSYYKCVFSDHFNYVPMHWHSEFEINYIHEGMAEFICGEEKFTSAIGDIIVIQPNIMHSIYTHGDIRSNYDTIVFSQEVFGSSNSDRYINECIKPLINGSIRVPTHITSKHNYYSELQMIVENIFSCAKGNTPQLDMLLRSEILRFFWLLETEAEVDINFNEPVEIIRPAIEYINHHYNENITIRQLAMVVHLSESYFMNQFQKYVGLSTIEYLSHFRINKACKLLINTKKSVLEIAFNCGFRNISNFNRQFKKIIGYSPTEYRKKALYSSTNS